MSKTTKQFNKMWEMKKITKPLVILYGGYAGTGKSTTCKKITDLINHTTSLPTGVIRSSIADYITNQDIELISSHTYRLQTVGEFVDPKKDENKDIITQRFLKQLAPIVRAINSVISFVASEKQHIIIDGNHIFPGLIQDNPDVNIIEFYNKVTDPNQHLKMLCGPTHNRTLDEDEFTTARILHDFTVDECKKNKKTIYEYDEAIKLVEKHLDLELSRIIKEASEL